MIRETQPPPCPYGMAHRAKMILAGLGISVSVGCKFLTAAAPVVQEFDCREKVLQPYIGDVFDVAQTVREIAKGQADLDRVLNSVGVVADDIEKAKSDLKACESKVTAPAPLPGDKVI